MFTIVLLAAFISGLMLRGLGYPPLLGYLVTGFVAQAYGIGSGEDIKPFSDFGITLLLFTIGLKLNLTKLAAPQVWGVAIIQMLISVLLLSPIIIIAASQIPELAIVDSSTAWTLAFALSFSSTVFAVKIFESRGETASLHATIAIGILIIQDLIAVVYLVLTSDKSPNLFTALLLLLPFVRPLLLKVMNMAGHGELLLLFGVGAAIGAYELFELVNLKGGLGALVFGVLLGNTEKSNELYKTLVQLKDLFLIGFFLLIGYYGLPSIDMWIMALILCLALVIRPVIYFCCFTLFKLRARTAFLSGFSLVNYSEFGLIVAAIAAENGLLPYEWLTTLALAMALSFFISTPINTRIHTLYSRYRSSLVKFERKDRLPVERFPDLSKYSIAIMGMGRVGSGAYDYLNSLYPDKVIGLEESEGKVLELQEKGFHCVHGDATDQAFWIHSKLFRCEKIFVCLTNHQENLHVVRLAKDNGFTGDFAVISRFPDHARDLEELGCVTFNLYAEAGHGFAEHALEKMTAGKQNSES